MLLIDEHKPFTEEERQAVVSIQSRFRTFQAQNTLDQVMRGDREAGAFQVYEALQSAKSMKRGVVDPEHAFGVFATAESLRKAYPGQLARSVYELTATVLSAATGIDTMLGALVCLPAAPMRGRVPSSNRRGHACSGRF
jgi:hypothetical protein